MDAINNNKLPPGAHHSDTIFFYDTRDLYASQGKSFEKLTTSYEQQDLITLRNHSYLSYLACALILCITIPIFCALEIWWYHKNERNN